MIYLTTLHIRCARMNVELINNERKGKKPESWQRIGEVRPLNARVIWLALLVKFIEKFLFIEISK